MRASIFLCLLLLIFNESRSFALAKSKKRTTITYVSQKQTIGRKSKKKLLVSSNTGRKSKRAKLKEEAKPPELEPIAPKQDTFDLARAYSLYDSGINQRLLGNYGTAINQLSEARHLFHLAGEKDKGAREPMEMFTLYELAQAADGANSYELATKLYQESLDNNSNFVPAYLKMARLKARQGKLETALQITKQALAVEPNNLAAHTLETLLQSKLDGR